MFLHQVSASKKGGLACEDTSPKSASRHSAQKGPPNCGTKGLRGLSMVGLALNSETPAAYRVCLKGCEKAGAEDANGFPPSGSRNDNKRRGRDWLPRKKVKQNTTTETSPGLLQKCFPACACSFRVLQEENVSEGANSFPQGAQAQHKYRGRERLPP